jgi:hypothetical protein
LRRKPETRGRGPAAGSRPLLQTEPGKWGLYRAARSYGAMGTSDASAPWDCPHLALVVTVPRFPLSPYGPMGAATLNTSARMACGTASVRPWLCTQLASSP